MITEEEELRRMNDEIDSKLGEVEEIVRLMRLSADETTTTTSTTSTGGSTVSRPFEASSLYPASSSLQEMTNSIKTRAASSKNTYISSSPTLSSPSCVDGVLALDIKDDALGDQHLNPKVNNRILQSRIESISKRLDHTLKLKEESDEKLKSQRKKHDEEKKQIEMELSRIKSLASSERQRAKLKASSSATKNELENLRAENQSLKKEVNSLQSIVKNAESKSQTREVRLKRALESVEKFKQMMLERKSERDALTAKSHMDVSGLQKKIKDLEKEKAAMRLGIQKQMQLIDILKRQKALVEASRMMDFTEREFENVLELGA